MGEHSNLTDDEKRAAVARVQLGETKTAVAKDYGVSGQAITLWEAKFGDAKAKAKAGAAAVVAEASRASAKKVKPKAKKKAVRRTVEPVVEESAPVLHDNFDADDLAYCWSLPSTLARVAESIRVLREEDDFDALDRAEAALAKHRSMMEARAA